MIRGAVASALLMCDRLRRCGALAGDLGADADELDLDKRIARGDRVVAYDVIGSCIDDLSAFREQLGDMLLGAESMARLAALAAKKGAERC